MKYILLTFVLSFNTLFAQSTDSLFVGDPYILQVELPGEKSKVDIYLYEVVSPTELKLIKTNNYKRLETQLRIKTSFIREGNYVYLIRIQNDSGIKEQKHNVKVKRK